MGQVITHCPVCGNDQFRQQDILWPELIEQWQLTPQETAAVNRQQGYTCENCQSNLRSMALASAILQCYGVEGTLIEAVETSALRELRVLEVNEAGTLHSVLSKLPKHRLAHFPELDLQNLDIEPGSVDLILHSDTLEHIEDPLRALSECRRVLGKDGICAFTVPALANRLTQSRKGRADSFHGMPGTTDPGLLVHWEFGADIWKVVLQAGFTNCTHHCIDVPTGVALIARG